MDDPYDFVGAFTRAMQAGQEFQRRRRLEQQEIEDRDIERQLLQHRLREIKIAERLQARQASLQNLQALEGLPASSFPVQATDEDLVRKVISPIPGVVPPEGMASRAVPEIEIPGIEELGVPPVKRKPMTMEDTLAAQLAELRGKALFTPTRVSRGGSVVLPATGEVLAEGQPISEPLVPYRTRDRSGRVTTEYVTREEAQRRGPAIMEPPPRQPPSPTVPEDVVEANVEGYASGDFDITRIPGGSLGARIRAGIRRRFPGFSETAAVNDLTALRTYLRGINSPGVAQNMLRAADTANAALDELEYINNRLKTAGWTASLPGSEGAREMTAAAEAVRDALAIIKRGGSPATDKALEDAEKALDVGVGAGIWKSPIDAQIARIRKALLYRTNAIKHSMVSPSEVTQPGTSKSDAEIAAALDRLGYDSSPGSVAKVKSNPAAMRELFGGK